MSQNEAQISQRVREQYERAPFPPVAAFPIQEGSPEDRIWLYSFPEVYYHAFGKLRTTEGARLLDAGCGTGHGLQQIRFHAGGAEVHACDFSSASINIARRRIEALGAGPVAFHELNLLDLKGLPGRFDGIFCSGVVHHTANPVRALRQLKSKLKPDGVLYLMLYSRFGRYPTLLMRRALQLLCRDPSDQQEGLHWGHQLFGALPPDHVLSRWERGVNKGHNLNHPEWFIDTYLNANEKNYSMREVFSDLAAAGLRFVRHAVPHRLDLATFLPGPPELLQRFAQLSEADRYEVMDQLFPEEQYYFMATHARTVIERPDWSRCTPSQIRAVPSAFARRRRQEGDSSLWQGYFSEALWLDAAVDQLIEACDGRASLGDILPRWLAKNPQFSADFAWQVLLSLERGGVLFFSLR